MPTDRDLFTEEQHMATMSFGEHIEELHVRLILALVGLLVGVIVAFIPYLDLGWRVMKTMEAPPRLPWRPSIATSTTRRPGPRRPRRCSSHR